uniref:Homing endonuclease LAGLIDADG domain-containing protein n=1 Tax=Halimeda minima TaxID=170427 RepID=A0A386AYW7_9CHLO|nr:hypothetical protein [Halimeda minima]
MFKNFIHGDNSQERLVFKNPQRLHVKQYVKLIIMYTENYEWVIGFIDGDGFLDLERIKNRDRFYYRPILSITQKNIKMLYKIKKILKIGRITKRSDGYYHYRVRNRRLFEQYLVPIFIKYPFLSNKKLQFKLILRCLRILKDYTDQDSQKQRCLNQIQIWIREARLRRLKTEPKNLSQTWLVGFFDSEGCISVSPLRARGASGGKQQSSKEASLKWRFVIKISQSKTNYLLLVAIRDFLNIGQIYKERSNIYYWGSHSFKDLSKLKSLFKKYPLKSEKHIQWIRFLKLLQIKDDILKPNQKKLERLILSFQKSKTIEDIVPTTLKNVE